jgi:hypothetical protein
MIRAEERPKTAFSTSQRHSKYKRVPFGLKRAPSMFTRLVTIVLARIQGIKCLEYLDDIVTIGEALQVHREKFRDVLDTMRKHNLKLQPDQCEFWRKKVTFLGHVKTEGGVEPDEEKVRTIREFQVPTCTEELQSLLGLAGYYKRLLPTFNRTARPLTELLRKNTPYNG